MWDPVQSLTNILHTSTVRWKLARWRKMVGQIEARAGAVSGLLDEELRKQSLSLKYRVRSGEPLHAVLPEAFALVREAATRQLKLRHFPSQLLGGIAIHFGSIAEMETGEGKTLTATLPAYLNALAGKGVHVATVNDYLASRDADWMRPVYESLGLRVGTIRNQMPQADRRQAYQCDITYGTAQEFGFDFLKDRLVQRRTQEGHRDLLGSLVGNTGGTPDREEPLQRAPFFALIDEADSILIDEARIPLIISAAPDQEQAVMECYRWSAQAAPQFQEDVHYVYDAEKKTVELTAAGRQLVRAIPTPPEMAATSLFEMYEFIERAIKINHDFTRERHYVVRNTEVVIVDEFTGRLAEGRRWRDGIHQAIEAREQLKISVATGHAAQVTVQEMFARYERLGGMTGTAWSSAAELRKVYRLTVVPIPTNRIFRRVRLPDQIYGTAAAKWEAIVAEVIAMHRTGRPVLIGTRSIDKSEQLSQLLKRAGVEHRMLHARHIAAEAEVVAEAGERGRVTVATNMAGRGTDIRLGEGVAELGGLHVIASEMHDSPRIDRQLAGRCGRQGDPGSFRQFLALDDEILQSGFGPVKAERLKQRGLAARGALNHLARLFRVAQQKVERKHFRSRKTLMYSVRQRKKQQLQMGQDPYLDTVS